MSFPRCLNQHAAFMAVVKASDYTNKKRIEEIKLGSKIAIHKNESGSVRAIQYYSWSALNNINIHRCYS
jgi:hypothetical protein